MSEFQYIISIALGQGILIAFFILTSRYYKTIANTWLAIALILLSTLSITDLIGSQLKTNSKWVEFFLNDIELGFLLYVSLYYYFRISTSSSTKNNSYFNYFLLLPFVIDTLINIAIVSYFPANTIGTHSDIQLFYEIETFLCIILNFFLCYKSYQLISDYDNSQNKKNWIKKIWQSSLLLLIVWFLISLGGFVMNFVFSALICALYILVSIWMFWILYNGIVNLKLIDDRKNINLKRENKVAEKAQAIYSIEKELVSAKAVKKQTNKAPSKSNLELLDNHFQNLKKLIVSKKMYRDEDFSIDDVAGELNLSAGYLSKIIKQATNKNFPTWINEFRVEEVKLMLRDEDFHYYTTLSIGLEAGFKSKSAFYATFKKNTGETPAQFRKKKS